MRSSRAPRRKRRRPAPARAADTAPGHIESTRRWRGWAAYATGVDYLLVLVLTAAIVMSLKVIGENGSEQSRKRRNTAAREVAMPRPA